MNRRHTLKAIAMGALTPKSLLDNNLLRPGISTNDPSIPSQHSQWQGWPDMDWVGPEFWGNRLQDWRLRDGKVECTAQDINRTLYWLTCQLGEQLLPFETQVIVDPSRIKSGSGQGYAGLRLGAKGPFKDYRSAAVFGKGLDVGLSDQGFLFIGELRSQLAVSMRKPLRLRLLAEPSSGQYTLTLSARASDTDQLLGEVQTLAIPNAQLVGNIALVSHMPQPQQTANEPNTYSFSDWSLSGAKMTHSPDQTFGPICFAQYTFHNKTLKLTAQLAPVETIASQQLNLQVRQGKTWKTLLTQPIDPQSRTAHFRVDRWAIRKPVPYRLVLTLPLRKGNKAYEYHGTLTPEPKQAEKVRVAVFSCNADHGFPDGEVVKHVAKQEADLAVFLGDQFYESTGGFGIQTSPLPKAILDYLRKWYMFGWSYRDIFRHIPCAIIPDDHDVYHGNIWGEGGKQAPTDKGWDYAAQDQGGYKMPPEWVNMVQRTQTSHLPDPYDPTPVRQGIGVYYTHWIYGGISFAILEDRKFKPAPKNVLPPEANVQNGFIQNPEFDIKTYRNLEADLLGQRQMDFLKEWVEDWRQGVRLKVVLSQTNFCTVATLPKGSLIDKIVPRLPIPEPGQYVTGDAPTADMDSNGWPQRGRDEAVKLIRKGFAFHIAGDQHIGSYVQYGVEEFADAGFAFAGPALNNTFPRRWWPPTEGHTPLPGQPAYTGNFRDGFGNRMTVMAVANPQKTGREPAQLYDRATGYGLVILDKSERTIRTECWPRYVDPIQAPEGQYNGWPLVINQLDNYGRKASAWLPEIQVNGLDNPVVTIWEEKTGEHVYSIRIKGNTFRPKVFAEGAYTIRVAEPDRGIERVEKGIRASPTASGILPISV